MKEITVLTVSQLNYYLKSIFESDENLSTVFLVGEISNLSNHYKSGHIYFSLKDDTSSLRAVMFSSFAKNVRFNLENGMKVLIRGHVSIYESTGQYQVYVEDIKPEGIGELNLAFEQLKDKLSKEGLFDTEKKKPLPRIPQRIGIVTSKSGAAIRDIENVISRRFPLATLIVCNTLVQGEEAPKQICEAIKRFNKLKTCDVLIVGRGGGSIEDLWAFNDESVARAVFNSKIPIISAVGHETDFTICDFVADLRAPTPSAAAELATPDINDLIYEVNELRSYLKRNLIMLINNNKIELDHIFKNLISPNIKLQEKLLELSIKHNKIKELLEIKLSRLTGEYRELISKLNALSPLSVLSRGYAIAYNSSKDIIKSVDQADRNIILKLKDGKLYLTLDKKESEFNEKKIDI